MSSIDKGIELMSDDKKDVRVANDDSVKTAPPIVEEPRASFDGPIFVELVESCESKQEKAK